MSDPPKDETPPGLKGEEPWTWERRYHPSLYDHMHALGVVAAHYNQLEVVFQLLFWRYSGVHSKPATRLFLRLNNNRNRLDTLQEWIEDKEFDVGLKERALHFVSAFEVCADNRNSLMHGRAQSPLSASDKLILTKAARRNPERQNSLELSLKDIRQVANDLDDLLMFGAGLYLWYRARQKRGTIRLPDGRDVSPPLPDIPPEPKKLTPTGPASQAGE